MGPAAPSVGSWLNVIALLPLRKEPDGEHASPGRPRDRDLQPDIRAELRRDLGDGGSGGGGAGGPSIGVLKGGSSDPFITGTGYNLGPAGSGGSSSGFDGPNGVQVPEYEP